MSTYTPTDDQVCEAATTYGGITWTVAEFDAWLKKHDAEWKAQLATSVPERTWVNAIKANAALLDQIEILQAQLAEANKTIDAIEILHPSKNIHYGSSTHGGPPQYRVGCACHGHACSTFHTLAEYRKKATS